MQDAFYNYLNKIYQIVGATNDTTRINTKYHKKIFIHYIVP